MQDEQEKRWEQRLRFVAKRYRENSLDADRAWQRFARRRGIRPAVPWRRYWGVAAAVLLLLAGTGSWWLTQRQAPEWVAVATAPGQYKEVWLPDSTEVALAGGSSVRYDRKKYGRERRVVELKGKAFFQVKRSEARPFSVYTAQTEVTVLGTSFQIKEEGSATEVNVVTGKVRFTAGENKEEDKVILTAGMSASYSMEKKEITLLKEEDLNRLAWKTKQLRFSETPLSQVIDDLSEFYGVKITNRAKSPDSKLTATFNDLPLDEVLMVVNQTLDVRLVPETKK